MNATTKSTTTVAKRRLRRSLTVLVGAATVTSGCASEEVTTTPTSVETTAPTVPGEATTTTEPVASTTTTTAPGTTTTTTVAPVECPPSWDTGAEVTAGWPSGLPTTGFPRLTDADVGAHPGYDRFVLDLADAGDLAYSVRWITGGPTADGSGDPVPMAGDVFMEVRLIGTAGWGLAEADWYDGPRDLLGASKGTVNLQQATLTGDFEGYVTWHLGAAEYAPFRVFTLPEPSRLVVDLCSVPGAIADQAAAAGCVGESAGIPASWIEGSSISLDLDGFPGEETVTAYADPDAGQWWFRAAAADGSWSSLTSVDGSSLVFEAAPLGGYDVDLDGVLELFARVDGGAYSEVVGVYVLDGCELQPTRNLEGGIMAWPIGASVMNAAMVECADPGAIVRSASVTADDTWMVEGVRLGLDGIVWEPMPMSAGLTYETTDLTPPFVADLACSLIG